MQAPPPKPLAIQLGEFVARAGSLQAGSAGYRGTDLVINLARRFQQPPSAVRYAIAQLQRAQVVACNYSNDGQSSLLELRFVPKDQRPPRSPEPPEPTRAASAPPAPPPSPPAAPAPPAEAGSPLDAWPARPYLPPVYGDLALSSRRVRSIAQPANHVGALAPSDTLWRSTAPPGNRQAHEAPQAARTVPGLPPRLPGRHDHTYRRRRYLSGRVIQLDLRGRFHTQSFGLNLTYAKAVLGAKFQILTPALWKPKSPFPTLKPPFDRYDRRI